MRKTLEPFCVPIPFSAGQIIIHEHESHAIVEIHAKLGWRIASLCDPARVGENKGRGSMNRAMRVFLCYSEKQKRMDEWKMEQSAAKRAEPVVKIPPPP